MIVPDSSEEGKCPGLESFRELRQLNVRMLYRPGLSNEAAFGLFTFEVISSDILHLPEDFWLFVLCSLSPP